MKVNVACKGVLAGIFEIFWINKKLLIPDGEVTIGEETLWSHLHTCDIASVALSCAGCKQQQGCTFFHQHSLYVHLICFRMNN
jgi:hypothetical protein